MAVTLPGELSEEGIRNAQALGHAATMASPPFSVRISGAVQTATIAFDGKRVVVIGHAAQRYALRSWFEGMPLEEAVIAGSTRSALSRIGRAGGAVARAR